MATAIPQTRSESLDTRRRWTRAEFLRAGELGLFQPDERLELLDGEVHIKMTQNSPHASSVSYVDRALSAILPSGLYIRIQAPLAVGVRSQPEPDIAVVDGDPEDYEGDHPASAVLVVEVADASLRTDLTLKAGLYASAGVAEYWVLNLPDRMLEVHREPAEMASQPLGHGYRSISRHPETDSLSPLFAPGATVAVAELLPRRRD